MNELQIVNLEQADITTWNFSQLKDELGRALSVYKTTVYTDETIKTAKDDKSRLAKAKKIVEDQRKAYKAKCLAPYEALEPQIKEIVGMIEEQRTAIDEVVKNFDERKKAEKAKIVRAYYDKKAFVLGDLADPLFDKLVTMPPVAAQMIMKAVGFLFSLHILLELLYLYSGDTGTLQSTL